MYSRARLLAPLAAVVLTLAAAGTASATPATRVISPTGTGIECSDQSPCSYEYATGLGSAPGDIVLALPGSYDLSVNELMVTHPLTIMGDPAQPRPVFESNTPLRYAMQVDGTAAGTVLRHLDIRGYFGLYVQGQTDASDLVIAGIARCASFKALGSTLTDSVLTSMPGATPNCLDVSGAPILRHLAIDAAGGNGVTLRSGGTLEDSTVTADNPIALEDGSTNAIIRRVSLTASKQAIYAMQYGWGLVTDSVIHTTGTTSAIQSRAGGKVTLRNDTVVAAGAGATGLTAEAAFASVPPGAIDARDVIVHASGADLVSLVAPDPAGCMPAPCSPGAVAVDHSLFASSTGPITDGGSNIGADPMFADAALGDFRLRAGSPAIDAGVADAETGATDFDGAARIQGATVDLGAFEAPAAPAQPPAPPSQPPAPAEQPSSIVPVPPADLTAPLLSGVRVSNRVFAVGRRATALSAVKHGTTLRYRVSENAQVTISLARRLPKGRFGQVATLTRRARSGANSAKLTGRIKRRALRPGSYRATLTARDAAGNTSRPATVKFTVVA